MTAQDLQLKINNLKDKLQLWQEGKTLIGLALFFENSSENFLTDQDLSAILPIAISALEADIKAFEAMLPELQKQYDEQRALDEAAEIERQQQEAIKTEAEKALQFQALILEQKEILLAQAEAQKLIDAEKNP